MQVAEETPLALSPYLRQLIAEYKTKQEDVQNGEMVALNCAIDINVFRTMDIERAIPLPAAPSTDGHSYSYELATGFKTLCRQLQLMAIQYSDPWGQKEAVAAGERVHALTTDLEACRTTLAEKDRHVASLVTKVEKLERDAEHETAAEFHRGSGVNQITEGNLPQCFLNTLTGVRLNLESTGRSRYHLYKACSEYCVVEPGNPCSLAVSKLLIRNVTGIESHKQFTKLVVDFNAFLHMNASTLTRTPGSS